MCMFLQQSHKELQSIDPSFYKDTLSTKPLNRGQIFQKQKICVGKNIIISEPIYGSTYKQS